MIYGATGYTGKLLAAEAVRRGLKPIVAGRDPDKVNALAKSLDAEGRAFSLDSADSVRRNLEGVRCVMHAAGPFTITAKPMLEACLTQRAHYLDITGEFGVFEQASALNDRAEAAGIMLMPGAGWDIVPSDCIALHAARRVKNPQSLRLALKHFGGLSRGSIKSFDYIAGIGQRARRNGVVVTPTDQTPIGVDFGYGPESCVPLPMGDIISAWKSTSIPNIEVYFAIGEPGAAVPVDQLPEGPTKAERDAGRSRAIADVTGADGKTVRSMIETTSGYSYTGDIGIEIASRVLAGKFKPGFQSPASAYDTTLATSVGASTITDLS